MKISMKEWRCREQCSCYCELCCNLVEEPYLHLSWWPFYSQGRWSIRCERENKLVHYSTACSAFCRGESDLFVRTAQSDVLFAGHVYFSLWLLINLNFSEAWSESVSFCLDLQNFKSVESGDVHQNILSSETWALGLQNLQAFRCWRRSSELLSSESSALDQKHNLQKLGLFFRTSCLRVFSLVSWQSTESSEADVLQSQNHGLQKRFRMLSFTRLTTDGCSLAQSQNLF